MKHSFDVEEANFDELVVARSHEVPVLLDIGAEWCSPCLVLGPMLEKLADEYAGKFVLAKVDADEITDSELSKKEREYILAFHSNDPAIGYNRNPPLKG